MRQFVRSFVLASALAGFSVVHAAPDTQGQWQLVNPLPFFPPHVHVLPTGNVLFWPGDVEKGGLSGNDPRIWDPATQTVTPATKPGFDPFCSGHTLLADGRLFVAGGHISNYEGSPKGSAYDPFTNSWSFFPNMNAGRWYPTATMLGSGDVLVVSGSIDNVAGVNKLPQVFQSGSGTWRNLTSAQLGQELYPMMLLAPNGKVFNPGPEATTRYLSTSGTGAWSLVGTRAGGNRTYGSAVMYAPGKVLVVGGSDPPKKSAEVIDLNSATPAWRTVAPMNFARRHLNVTLLPDGKVLVTGGTSGPGFNNKNTPVYASELWDPVTEKWSVIDTAEVPRLYHSATVLLPDGRVLSVGGNGYTETEIYSPPYLFNGTRPAIASAPASVAYGESFFVETPDAAAIARVRMIRLSSTTHSFNMGQHLAVAAFSAAAGGLTVTAPANGNLAPPGHYLLFILNGSGVPSVAKIVKLGGSPPPPAGPTVTSLQPDSATAGGPAFTLTVNGTNFVNGTSVVRWNGANRTTTFVSATQLTASIPASDIAATGTKYVRVANGSTVSSPAAKFNVTTASSSTPSVTSLSPATVKVNGPAFTLTVNGANFVSGVSVVRWNGANRPTTFVSPTQLTAAIPASDITTTGDKFIRVANGSLVSAPAVKVRVTQ